MEAFCDCSKAGPRLRANNFKCYVVYACDHRDLGDKCETCVCVHELLLFLLIEYTASTRTSWTTQEFVFYLLSFSSGTTF